MYLHVDGARIANAAAALGGDVRSVTADAGVDVLTFGGTKNGAMYGEAVVLFDPELARSARFLRKQAGQLPSKTRYVAAQFEALLTDGLWLANAGNANRMAERLVDGVRDVPGVDLLREPEVNGVFVHRAQGRDRPAAGGVTVLRLGRGDRREVRWMCSLDTTEADVDAFVAGVRSVLVGGQRS